MHTRLELIACHVLMSHHVTKFPARPGEPAWGRSIANVSIPTLQLSYYRRCSPRNRVQTGTPRLVYHIQERMEWLVASLESGSAPHVPNHHEGPQRRLPLLSAQSLTPPPTSRTSFLVQVIHEPGKMVCSSVHLRACKIHMGRAHCNCKQEKLQPGAPGGRWGWGWGWECGCGRAPLNAASCLEAKGGATIIHEIELHVSASSQLLPRLLLGCVGLIPALADDGQVGVLH